METKKKHNRTNLDGGEKKEQTKLVKFCKEKIKM